MYLHILTAFKVWFPCLSLCPDLWPRWQQPWTPGQITAVCVEYTQSDSFKWLNNEVWLKFVILQVKWCSVSTWRRCKYSHEALRWPPVQLTWIASRVKLYLFVFITARVFNPVLDSLTSLQNQSYRWGMNKAPLPDLQAMSIKLEHHVLCVIHSHAASTPHWCHITFKFVHSRTNISHICFSIKLQTRMSTFFKF